MTLDKLFSTLKTQGFHGHQGRPGKRGGSLPKSGGFSNEDYQQRKTAMTGYFKKEASKVTNSLEQGRTAKGDELDRWEKEKAKLQKQVDNPTTSGNAEDSKAAIDLINEHVLPAIQNAQITMLPKTVMPDISPREQREILRSITGNRR